MKLPFANDLPEPVRAIGRRLLKPQVRARVAAEVQHIAHFQSRLDPRFRRSIAALRALRNRHQNEACVIIGNGPSIAGEDLGQFRGVTTFCLNRGYLLWREKGLSPSYLVAVNDLVLEQFHSELTALGRPLFVPWEHHHRFQGNCEPVFLELRWHQRFHGDVTGGLWAGATVTFAALQLAYHMGFRTVVLIGVDHRFADKGKPHEVIQQASDDCNHFSPNYFGKGVRWNLPDLNQSEIAYRMARTAYELDGRRIIDATSEGALEVFPKMTLRETFDRGMLVRNK